MAYEIVRCLKRSGEETLLKKLQRAVSVNAKSKGKIHEVFEPPFDEKDLTIECPVLDFRLLDWL